MSTCHVVGLPWTETTEEFITCAYTQKIVKFGRMMQDSDYRVIVYSGVENTTPCDEHVVVVREGEREEWFGEHDQNTSWGHVTWDALSVPWTIVNARAKRYIAERAETGDLILLIAGSAQAPLFDVGVQALTIEPFVGYYGIASQFCAFESYAWRHHIYGNKGWEDGRNYDTVIPNYFDSDDFPYTAHERDDYLLFVGRVTSRKGVQAAAEVAKACDRQLLVAGPGVTHHEEGKIVGDGVTITGDVQYVGVADKYERALLMSKAAALLAPTQYIEPFCGVSIEAMLCGTPVVSTDWGAFTENVVPGRSGYRFATLRDGVDAVNAAVQLDNDAVRAWAEARFTLEAVRPQFEQWFRRLDGLRRAGWYELPEEAVA